MDKQLIDDAFYMEKKSFGTWQSFDKDGKGLVTSLTEEKCIAATRYFLKGLQEGWDDANIVRHNGTVDGKL